MSKPGTVYRLGKDQELKLILAWLDWQMVECGVESAEIVGIEFVRDALRNEEHRAPSSTEAWDSAVEEAARLARRHVVSSNADSFEVRIRNEVADAILKLKGGALSVPA